MTKLTFEEGHYVYQLCDDFQPLYVGYTNNPTRRIGEHRASKEWFGQVTNVAISRFETKREALKAEAFSIDFGENLYNLDLNKRLSRDAFKDARSGGEVPAIEHYQVPIRRI